MQETVKGRRPRVEPPVDVKVLGQREEADERPFDIVRPGGECTRRKRVDALVPAVAEGEATL